MEEEKDQGRGTRRRKSNETKIRTRINWKGENIIIIPKNMNGQRTRLVGRDAGDGERRQMLLHCTAGKMLSDCPAGVAWRRSC